jgi:hypothetical protein
MMDVRGIRGAWKETRQAGKVQVLIPFGKNIAACKVQLVGAIQSMTVERRDSHRTPR